MPEATPYASTAAALIRQVEDEILQETRNEREKLVTIGRDGSVVFAKAGTLGEVRLSQAEMDRLRGTADLLTHNHPSGGGIGLADFGIAVEVNARELHAFGARYRYRLSRLGSTWPDLRTSMLVLDRLQRRVKRSLQARVNSGTLTAERASLRFWHEVWTRFAREVSGVHYRMERR